MPAPLLTLKQAQAIQLSGLGLLVPLPAPAQKSDVLSTIRQLGILQLDTIHVVARSQYLVLFSRLGNYDPAWLNELQAERAIIEQWAHAACLLPIEDFPLARRFVLNGETIGYFGNWVEENRVMLDSILETVRSNGPTQSSDFKSPKGSGGWWNRKLEKWALEYWFGHGELLVPMRGNFQRVYDLTERVLPGWNDEDVPSSDTVYRQLVLKTIRALGVAKPSWLADYYRLKKKKVAALLPELLDSGEVRVTAVEGWDEPALYLPDQEEIIDAGARDELVATHTTLLSPFDPLVWDRARTRQLFGFDFMIQAYTVAEKRQYGYFPLPILHRGKLVGRLDAKAHRKEGIFEVKTLYLEELVKPSQKLAIDLAKTINCCARWHQTPHVVVNRCTSAELETQLRDAINS